MLSLNVMPAYYMSVSNHKENRTNWVLNFCLTSCIVCQVARLISNDCPQGEMMRQVPHHVKA